MFDALADPFDSIAPLAHDSKHAKNVFLHDVIHGLKQPQKSIAPKYFYDTCGSQYFDEICELQEYYPYRTELSLLPKVAKTLSQTVQSETAIIEFGAGSLKKIQPLLQEIENISTFVPIDIAGDFLSHQCEQLQAVFPQLEIHPVVADFCHPVDLHSFLDKPKLGFFPGSTIGNFSPEEAVDFLKHAAKTLGSESQLLIGVDTKKSPKILHNAYNDNQGVTAKFNLNLLQRINRELAADFELDAFEHYAFYNAPESRIEMHLISQTNQTINIADQEIAFTQGESIHTECSYKYNPEEFLSLAKRASWQPLHTWLSDDEFFSMHLLICD